jgi:hypothetical protein
MSAKNGLVPGTNLLLRTPHTTHPSLSPQTNIKQKVGGTNLKRWVAPIEENAGNEGKTLIRNAV